MEEQGSNFAQSPEGLLYNGPYTMTKFDSANGVTLKKNENYWDAENVDVEQINARVVKEVETRVSLYESGDLDYAELTSDYVDQYKNSPEFSTLTTFSTSWLEMNREDPVMKNDNIRKALQQGFDRQVLTETVLNDGSVPAEGYVRPGVAGPENQTFREAAGPTGPGFDPERARKLYEQGVEELSEEPTIELLIDDTPRSRTPALSCKPNSRTISGPTSS